MTCWPDGYPASGTAEHPRPEYGAQWIGFTSPCLILIDTDGALHARYETEGCTTLEEPANPEYAHDPHGLDDLPEGTDWKKVFGGQTHACALDSVGRATCWGRYLLPEGAAPTDLRFTELAAGDESTCGITTEGKIHCWTGIAPNDSGVNSWIPHEVPTSSGWVHITMSPDYACAIDGEGQVHCFGNIWRKTDIHDALKNPVAEPPTTD